MMNKKHIGIALSAMATFGLVSCSNDLTPDMPGNSGDGNNGSAVVTPVKSPDIVAWSGAQTIGSTLPASYGANAGDGWVGQTTWSQFKDPVNITDAEKAGVKAALEAKVTGSRISESIVFPWPNYFLQDVVSATETDTPSKSYEFEAYSKNTNGQFWHNGDHTNYVSVANSGQITHYRQVEMNGSQVRIDKTALMIDMAVGTYDEMKEKQFQWYINCHENLHWSEYIVVEYDNNYYICFDFACGHKENDVDGNPGRGNTQNDWDYNDWIIKISPAIPANNPDYQVPRIWDGSETTTPEPPVVTDPENPSVVYASNEVEVNLAINDLHDYDIADLVSKLSIHIRAPYDVEVLLPVQTKIYCDQDDLYIFDSHDGKVEYGGLNHKVEYDIAGTTVTLSVEFLTEGDGAIKVTTQGINADVINYCQAQNGDGINFEVYNYYNRGGQDPNAGYEVWSVGDLKEALDQSSISFFRSESSLNPVPDYYINAFTGDIVSQDNEQYYRDCYVTPTDSYINYFLTPFYGLHYNGKETNLKYCGAHVTGDPKEGDVTNHDRFGVNALR